MIQVTELTCEVENAFQPDPTGSDPITSQGLLSLAKSIREDILENEAFRNESLRLAASSIMK